MPEANETLIAIDRAERIFGGGKTLFGKALPAVHAVQDVTLDVKKGETLGIVGESGCGKSTLARLLSGLDLPTGGKITFEGRDLAHEAKKNPRALARQVQYVFQDPVSSLNPRKKIRTILEAPLIHLLKMNKAERAKRLEELMDAVNLAPEFLERYPHEFSGGQAQRIGIARALAADPEVIVLDEPVSALDVSVQAQVLNILDDLKSRFGLTYLFISHDLSVVESISDRVAVMYFGRIVELGSRDAVFAEPLHPYTHLLLNSAPAPGRRAVSGGDSEAELPDPYNPPKGCAFFARCPNGTEHCQTHVPPIDEAQGGPGHEAACFHPMVKRTA
ncbi:ABC transporter ATP-binding protein [Martelella mediterranea]|uniref:Putative D,D-dipeptide transport ATP-binding protein DdpF n=1 Tax=Martelella mediterranea DSM 17316 TaxID=1122214 RepID=A0A1U9YVF7_9HYPH|nr:oligopeptide/dipeptide ABC transporter ATP-binding protein [Martelella mediterranea]AQZ49409.1 putative D,D-dipeptide transport ATP-binding protein DdpF [Martelella mediterranea DSM 17316]